MSAWPTTLYLRNLLSWYLHHSQLFACMPFINCNQELQERKNWFHFSTFLLFSIGFMVIRRNGCLQSRLLLELCISWCNESVFMTPPLPNWLGPSSAYEGWQLLCYNRISDLLVPFSYICLSLICLHLKHFLDLCLQFNTRLCIAR